MHMFTLISSKFYLFAVQCMHAYIGRYTEAENKFKESLEINPDQPMTYNNLGILLNTYHDDHLFFLQPVCMEK